MYTHNYQFSLLSWIRTLPQAPLSQLVEGIFQWGDLDTNLSVHATSNPPHKQPQGGDVTGVASNLRRGTQIDDGKLLIYLMLQFSKMIMRINMAITNLYCEK